MAGDGSSSSDGVVTAAILVIGDEILSGRTKDKNIGYIAEYLTNIGVDLREVRVVPDIEEEIVTAINALRKRYDNLFTTGGIGPTHDDITADCVAKAFGVSIDIDPRAVEMLKQRVPPSPLTEARLRMARIPDGAALIANPVSFAPGFTIGNVHVMAGVPSIMQAMLDNVAPTLKTGKKVLSRSVPAKATEGQVATPLRELQTRFPDVTMGSYPSYVDGVPTTTLVLRSRDEARLNEAEDALNEMLETVWRNQAPRS